MPERPGKPAPRLQALFSVREHPNNPAESCANAAYPGRYMADVIERAPRKVKQYQTWLLASGNLLSLGSASDSSRSAVAFLPRRFLGRGAPSESSAQLLAGAGSLQALWPVPPTPTLRTRTCHAQLLAQTTLHNASLCTAPCIQLRPPALSTVNPAINWFCRDQAINSMMCHHLSSTEEVEQRVRGQEPDRMCLAAGWSGSPRAPCRAR